jgi:antitoxin Xre/MbcA/ParS-like protein
MRTLDLQNAQTSSEKSRKVLTEVFFNLARHWELTRQQEAKLLGWNYAPKRATLDAMRKGRSTLDDDQDKLERVIDLVNIHKSLRVLFPAPSERARVYEWVKVKRERFGGYSALDIMLSEGKTGIHAIRRYLDHERTR